MTESGEPRRGRGRPRRDAVEDGPGARERILLAARSEFGERGYDRASVRGIAKRAKVDPSLVHHYFASKEGVFEAAMEVNIAPAMDIPQLFLADAQTDIGERLTRFVFGIWEHALTREPLLAMVRSAVNNETAAAIFRRMITRRVLKRVTPALSGPDAELRVELAVAQLVGTAMLRYLIKLEPVASADVDELIAQLAPVVQYHLTGTPPTPRTQNA
ncbi:TetR family transcriptional regulator [Streptomyces sp. NPDC057743]|uniref:TetR/AcrR family transcriptional regulator n=1 Tax=Streptomyces sp. NPDC057743 TaxID=3346236 RepID=UPI0036AE7C0E